MWSVLPESTIKSVFENSGLFSALKLNANENFSVDIYMRSIGGL